MTRKDYTLIAEALYRAKPSDAHALDDVYMGWGESVNQIADALAGENNRFDASRFLAACGYSK